LACKSEGAGFRLQPDDRAVILDLPLTVHRAWTARISQISRKSASQLSICFQTRINTRPMIRICPFSTIRSNPVSTGSRNKPKVHSCMASSRPSRTRKIANMSYQYRVGKPIALTGFGLVTQNNAPDFVPFNSTQVSNSTNISPTGPNTSSTTRVTDDQRNSAYQQWLQGRLSYPWPLGDLILTMRYFSWYYERHQRHAAIPMGPK